MLYHDRGTEPGAMMVSCATSAAITHLKVAISLKIPIRHIPALLFFFAE